MRSGSEKKLAVLISFDHEKQKEKREQSDYCEVPNALEKPIILQPSDETADVSESDSDFGSEDSFSIIPYPNSDDDGGVIPATNFDEHQVSFCSESHIHTYRADEKRGRLAISKWCMLIISLLVAFFGYRFTVPISYDVTSDRETVYCPGAGFSGFWYTLGRLQSIGQPNTKDYYCFSAGCLGVVASMRNFTVDETLDIALNIQQRWKTGQIKRHDVVGEFVDTLVDTTSSTKSDLVSVEESKVLERMHVITSTKNRWIGMKTHIRSPQTAQELREMLLQTTWIPFAVGKSLWHTDSMTGTYHMDGAFTMPFHPKATHTLGLPPSPEILLNVINVNISLEKVKQFWRAGFARGV